MIPSSARWKLVYFVCMACSLYGLFGRCSGSAPSGEQSHDATPMVDTSTLIADTLGATTVPKDSPSQHPDLFGATCNDCKDPRCEGQLCGQNCVCSKGAKTSCSAEQLSALFKRRIEPLLQKGRPSSCNQCHLSGIDLGLFVQDTPCHSMACLLSRGEVDLKNPETSRILQMIKRAKPQSSLITQQVQDDEYKGFFEWIQFSARCHQALCGDIPDACGPAGQNPAPQTTLPMLGGCDEQALVNSFRSSVAKWRGRCESCHSANGTQRGDEKLKIASTFFDVKTDYDGDRRTMYNMIGRKIIDTKNPEASLLLTKPLPTHEGGVEHGGGNKIASKNEQTYKDILQWIKQYTSCL